MSDAAYPGPFAQDNPIRRLPWILVFAVLLVLLALVGLGRLLHPAAQQSRKPRPLQARIYELPASKGGAPATPAHNSHRSSPAHTAHSRASHAQRQTPVRTPRSASSSTGRPQTSRSARIAKSSGPSKSSSLDWNTLQSQINAAVSQNNPSLPQIHDPHTIVARYYIASLLRKLQRVGEMNDPTDLTGMPVIKLVIGVHGELKQLTLVQSSGNQQLDRDALQIARESAPFSAFPHKLRHQTKQIALVCYMHFEGYRQLYAGF